MNATCLRAVLSLVLVTLVTLVAPAAADVMFEKAALPTTAGAAYTTVTLGPDGQLYGTTNTGEIRRWPLFADGTTGAVEILGSLRAAEGGNRLLICFVFDPAATADSLVAWVSHSTYGFTGMADWAGKITRLSGPSLETVADAVIRLPRSFKDHVTNGLVFGPDGALYVLQGSNSTMGAPDATWSNRLERLLTAALLRLDTSLVTPGSPLDAKTAEGGTYDPYAPGAPLTLYATGIRNAYDLVWHTNGFIYVPTNGSASNGNTPEGPLGAACGDGGTYAGPYVPPLTGVSERSDYLFRIVPGGYYGHPNPTRCTYVLNGGNPTAGADPAEVAPYPVGTLPDAAYRGFAYDFGLHRSPNGVIEYRNNHTAGALRGKLLVVRYSQGDDIIVLEPGPSGDIVAATTGIPGFTGFSDPLDLTEDRATGRLYVSEYGAQKITLLRPLGPVAVPDDVPVASPSLSLVPNPLTPRSSVTVSIAAPGEIDLALYDLAGRRVRTLARGPSPAGHLDARWDGRSDTGERLPSGVYFLRLRADGVSETRRIALLSR